MCARLARYVALVFAAVLAVALVYPAAPAEAQRRGAGNPNNNNNNKPRPQEDLSDAAVVDAMNKGVQYLLQQKKGDNWELHNFQKGGETAIALYALLNVGQSLDDPKLSYRSDDLAPVVKYLVGLDYDHTYTASLTAAALSFCNKKADTEPAMERLRLYLMDAMGGDGGYTYEFRGDKKLFNERNEIAGHAADLRKQMADARLTNDQATLKSLGDDYQKVLADLQRAQAELDRSKGGVQGALAGARAHVADLSKQLNEEMLKKKPDQGRVKDLQDQVRKAQTEADATAARMTGFNAIGDLSNSQYGALGAWALSDAGFEIPTTYWRVTDRFWRHMQLPSGQWAYWVENGDKNPRETMTLAGVASLFVTNEFLDTELRLEPKVDKNIQMGLKEINATFRASNRGENLYYLYGVERVGLASGLKFFNQANWYKEGALFLLKSQHPDGSWDDHGPIVGTAYALLFLARGRNPVVFNKLEYAGPWDARPRDNANITGWMSKKFERPINWQSVNLKVEPEEWLDAPILLITGSRELNLTEADITKLRLFVHAGGIIFSTADGGTPAFTDAIKSIGSQLVHNQYEWRDLPPEHPIFNLWSPITNPPRMLGLSNGSREFWIHATTDMGASWQRRAIAAKNDFEIPANIFFYATGKGSLRSKLQSLTVIPSAERTVRTIALARVQYPSNWNPEPGAWPRLAKIAQAEFHTDLHISVATPASLNATLNPVAHITGTAHFTMPEPDIAALRNYVTSGGTLIADDCSGSGAFSESFLDVLTAMFPGNKPVQLAADHPLYKGAFTDGADVTNVEYRKFAQLKMGRVTTPRLYGIELNGRLAVIFSNEDITSGLLGTNTWGIVGYTADSAEDMARNIVLYATQKK